MIHGKGIKIGKYTYYKSDHINKKLMTTVDKKNIYFGDAAYEQYKDKTGIWTTLDHNNESRRRSYLKRSKGIKDKDGNITWKDPKSANYHAIRVLW